MPRDPDDGILGFRVEQGHQSGTLDLAGAPDWDGFIQCDFCQTPSMWPHPRALAYYRVDADGAHSCGNCRRRRYCHRGGWYTSALRVFRPGVGAGALPVRVVPREVFAAAAALYPRPGQQAQRNSYLLAYAAAALQPAVA